MVRPLMPTPPRDTFYVRWDADGEGWRGGVAEFPILEVEGNVHATAAEALTQIKAQVVEHRRELRNQGHRAGPGFMEREFSGEVRVHVLPAVHRQLAKEADTAGVSLVAHIRDVLDHRHTRHH